MIKNFINIMYVFFDEIDDILMLDINHLSYSGEILLPIDITALGTRVTSNA